MLTPLLARGQLVLRPAGSADLGLLYSIASQSGELWPRVCQQGLPNPQQFEQLAWASVQVLLVVVHQDLAHPLGLAAVYDLNHRDGTAWVEVLLPLASSDDEAAVTEVVVGHALDTWGLRKVYLRHDAFRPAALGALTRPSREEARLREHVLHDGFYWDTVTTAVYRDETSMAV